MQKGIRTVMHIILQNNCENDFELQKDSLKMNYGKVYSI